MNIKVAIPIFLIFSLVMQAYALQPQLSDNELQMHGVDAYGGAYGCVGYMCSLVHTKTPTPTTSKNNVESVTAQKDLQKDEQGEGRSHQPIISSSYQDIAVRHQPTTSIYAVIFSGSTQATYYNMADYQRLVVIGNDAYTMGSASDYLVTLNKIPLVTDTTDQNTYVKTWNLQLICCDDQAISVLIDNGQKISSTDTGGSSPQDGTQDQNQQPQSAIPNTVYLIFPAIAVVCIIYYVIGVRVRFRNSRNRRLQPYHNTYGGNELTSSEPRITRTVDVQGNVTTETTTEEYRHVVGWDEETWMMVKENHPKDWDRFLKWVATHKEDVDSIVQNSSDFKDALYTMLNRMKNEGYGDDMK